MGSFSLLLWLQKKNFRAHSFDFKHYVLTNTGSDLSLAFLDRYLYIQKYTLDLFLLNLLWVISISNACSYVKQNTRDPSWSSPFPVLAASKCCAPRTHIFTQFELGSPFCSTSNHRSSHRSQSVLFLKKTSCISQLKTPQCISIGFGITSKFLTMVNTLRHELSLPTSLALSQTAPSSSSRPQTPSGFEVSAQPTRRLLALLVLENVP